MKKINWKSGNGIILFTMGFFVIMVFMMIYCIETGMWYRAIAAVQTKTDAIAEGVALSADTGVVEVKRADDSGVAAYGVDSNTETTLNVKKAAEVYERLLKDNKNNLKDNFGGLSGFGLSGRSNASESLVGYNGSEYKKLSNSQRVLTVVLTIEGNNLFNATKNNHYSFTTQSKVRIIGVELPLEDSLRFADLYSNDLNVPITALTTTGDNAIYFQTNGDFKDSITANFKNESNATMYAAVLDQFYLGNGDTTSSETSKEYATSGLRYSTANRYQTSGEYSQYNGNEYIYASDGGSSVTLSPAQTFLWDVSYAMNCEIPRYVKNVDGTYTADTYENWVKGRQNVELKEIDLKKLTESYYGCSSLGRNAYSAALNKANSGVLTFAVTGSGEVYVVRPTQDNGRTGSSDNSAIIACAFPSYNGKPGSNNQYVNFASLGSCNFYYKS